MKAVDKYVSKYRYSVILLRELVITDFKLRYQGSILGYLWSLLKPLALFAILYIVFVKFLKIGHNVPHYAIYLLLGIVLWNFFVEISLGSVSAIVGKGDLIRKINFPKYVILIAGSCSALINLSFNLIVVIIFMFLFGANPSPWAIIVAPLLLIELYFLGLAVAFFLSATYVKYRDVGFIWEVVLQAGFYATPILYPIATIPEKYRKILILNPMAQILQDARHFLVTPDALTSSDILNTAFSRVIPLAIVIILIITGAIYFRNHSKYFAEKV